MSDDSDDTLTVSFEDAQVEAWRIARFLDMRFPMVIIEAFLRRGIDYHEVEGMLERGCSRANICRVLL